MIILVLTLWNILPIYKTSESNFLERISYDWMTAFSSTKIEKE